MGSTRYYLFSSIYKWGKMYLEYHSVENKGETVTSSSFITCNLKIVFKIYYFDWSCWFHITNLKFITIPSEVNMKQSSDPSRCHWRVQFKFTKYVKRLTWNKKYMDLEKLFKKRYSLSCLQASGKNVTWSISLTFQ